MLLVIIIGIILIIVVAANQKKGGGKISNSRYDAHKAAIQQIKNKRAELEYFAFNTPIDDKGLSFFFDCHSHLMKSEFVVIDFETATKLPMSVVSLGITSFKNGHAVTREWMFKPYNTKEFEFSHLHGITPDMVADKPQFHEVWPDIEPLLNGKVIICHNAQFDLSILQNLINRRFLAKSFKIRYICTLELSRQMLKKYGYSCSLENLCRIYNIPHGKHNGGRDTISTLMLLDKLFYEEHRADTFYIRTMKGKVFGPRLIGASD